MTHGVDAIESAGQAFGDEAARISEAANATIVTIRTLAADLSKKPIGSARRQIRPYSVLKMYGRRCQPRCQL